MSIKKTLLALCIVCQISAEAAPIERLHAVCPSVDELNKKTISGTNMYEYSATIPLDFSPLHDELYLSGNATADQAHYFFGATWTDRSFLCLYDFDKDPIIIFETVLGPYVDRCYFENAIDRPRDECNASDPKICFITCEIAH